MAPKARTNLTNAGTEHIKDALLFVQTVLNFAAWLLQEKLPDVEEHVSGSAVTDESKLQADIPGNT